MSMMIADQEGFAAFLLRMRARGINDKALLVAVESVPRRNFVSGQWQDAVWLDQMIPIECGETLEGLDLQATAIAALGLQPHHRVLEIGTGSGYTTSLLAKLGGRVISLDRYKRLLDQARRRIDALGLANVVLRQGDGSKGLGAEGPFDRIIAWAAFPEMPRHFVDQLSTNGVMIAAIGPEGRAQELVRLTKTGSRFERENIGKVRLQPLREGVAAAI